MTELRGRREFLTRAAGSGLILVSSQAFAAPKSERGGQIPPTEDLMREHGVLRRILLIYDEAARRLVAGDPAVVSVIAAAANIVRHFVEGYHEKLEEQFVLPTLEKAGKLIELAGTIRVQHAAGRKLTESILKISKESQITSTDRSALAADMQSFGHMYAAHAAWEDTELFPVYRARFTESELGKLGDSFEEQEHKLLGSGGFEGSLKAVGDLEQQLGIHDLAKYTPR